MRSESADAIGISGEMKVVLCFPRRAPAADAAHLRHAERSEIEWSSGRREVALIRRSETVRSPKSSKKGRPQTALHAEIRGLQRGFDLEAPSFQ